MFSIGLHKAQCFFITKVVYLPPVKLGVFLLTQYNRREQKQLLSAAFICRFMGITNLVTCFIIRVRGFLLNANREIDFSVSAINYFACFFLMILKFLSVQ